jgi:hypothetical protein
MQFSAMRWSLLAHRVIRCAAKFVGYWMVVSIGRFRGHLLTYVNVRKIGAISYGNVREP